MANDFKSSFIPKEPLAKKGGASRGKKGTLNVVSLIAWIIFILSVLAGVSVFLYNIYLGNSLESKKARLADEREEFDSALIDELVRLDVRLETASSLLSSHRAVSNLFEELEGVTTQSVRFDSFRYSAGEEEGAPPTVSMSGTASDFNAVAFQSDVLGNSRSFRNIIFSGLEVTPGELVNFNITASVNPEVIRYQDQGTDSVEEITEEQ